MQLMNAEAMSCASTICRAISRYEGLKQDGMSILSTSFGNRARALLPIFDVGTGQIRADFF